MINIILVLGLFLYSSCTPRPPPDECFYGYNFIGTVRDGLNNPIVAVEIKYSVAEENVVVATTDANGEYKFFDPSYVYRKDQSLIFSKTGFQTQVAAAFTANEVDGACNVKLNLTRDVVLVP